MCQLLGMNCKTPTDICFSFKGFCERGGNTDEHADGWGIGFFEETGCRLFHDDRPSSESLIAKMVKEYPIKAMNVIAHIRKATIGAINLENTHPFVREIWGKYWIFAHNGDLKNFKPDIGEGNQPVGSTDSELAFCYIANEMRRNFGSTPPSICDLRNLLQKLSTEIAKHGTFNFLLSCGGCLFAHRTTKLQYIVRESPFSVAHLLDKDIALDFNDTNDEEDRVVVIATEPLTSNEVWTDIPQGEVVVFHQGRLMKPEDICPEQKLNTPY